MFSPLVLSVLCLSPALATTPVIGRDFQPNELSGATALTAPGAYSLVDAVYDAPNVLLFVTDATHGSITTLKFNPSSGTVTPYVRALQANRSASSLEYGGLWSGNIATCQLRAGSDASLTSRGAGRWAIDQIGVDPTTITLAGTGAGCRISGPPSGHLSGYYDPDSGTYSTDSVVIAANAKCTGFSATYLYSTCSLAGTDA